MAGRSDFNSVCQRQTKRLIGMGLATGHIQDKHHASDVYKLFIAAHKIEKAVKQKKMASFVDTSAKE